MSCAGCMMCDRWSLCWLHGMCEGGLGGVCAGCMVCVRVG